MSLFKGASIYLVSNILNSIIPFLLLPILTRYLSPAEYGQIAMFQILLAGIGTFIGLNAVGAANRKFYDNNIDDIVLRNFNGICIQILFISSIIVFIGIFLFKNQLSDLLSIPTSWILASVIISALSFITSMRLGQWQIRSQAKLFGILQVSSSLVNMLLSLLFVIILSKGAQGRIDAQVITGSLAAIIAIIWLYKDKLIQVKIWEPSLMKEALYFGIPLIPHSIGSLFLNIFDRFVINRDLGLYEVGIYMVAVQLSSSLLIIFDAFNKSYIPWLFDKLKNNNSIQKLKIVKSTYVIMLSLLLFSIIPFLIGPFFIRLIAGDKYELAGNIIGILCLGQVFSGMYLLVTNYIFYAKKTKYLAYSTIISGFIGIGLLFSLVKEYGIVGAAVAFLCAKIIHFIITFVIAIKAYKMPWGLKL
ncbi:polysaccharide biosynthesis protein [Photobacterium damselae subsp. damselae]|uniref:oligosaccharide flippase family protein n=1 Tax=Photobacterium damselae TaxID=38293 RepID=UPI0010FD0B73|nr:oligosaccharide flippase family protein [Photobacterium damselae]TLS80846.1 polysaccharide biosynthesis protein [Photobacterium damselae subsp. damselae]TLS87219.1 polysaccharide biosynthesis protein [Photobacterium damselae subsp. damselae]